MKSMLHGAVPVITRGMAGPTNVDPRRVCTIVLPPVALPIELDTATWTRFAADVGVMEAVGLFVSVVSALVLLVVPAVVVDVWTVWMT